MSNLPRAKVARIRELSVGYVVDSDFPFTALEGDYIQELFRELNRETTAQVPWIRSTIKRDLDRLFLEKKPAIKEELSKSLTQTHISFDLWTSPNNLAFIAILCSFYRPKTKVPESSACISTAIRRTYRRQYRHHDQWRYSGVGNFVQDWGRDL